MFGSFPPSPLVGLRLQSLLERREPTLLWNHYTVTRLLLLELDADLVSGHIDLALLNKAFAALGVVHVSREFVLSESRRG
jgi:hypothetical protein